MSLTEAEKLELKQINETIEKVKKDNLCYFFKPYKWQRDLLELIRKKNTGRSGIKESV